MQRLRSVGYNTISSAIYQLVVFVYGFIIPKLILSNYGSDANGLVTSVTQFINYFKIVEAGLGGAAIFELYKPLATKNHELTNRIVSTTKVLYYKVGGIFLLLVSIMSVLYPFTVRITFLSKVYISLLVIFIGLQGVIDFFSMAKYRTLLTADQRGYVVQIAMTVSQLLNMFIIAGLASMRISLVWIYAGALLPTLLRSYILRFYVLRHYNYLNSNLPEEKGLMANRWNVLYLNIVQAAQGAGPTMIATFTLGLLQVSIYSIYGVVFNGLNMVFGMLPGALQPTYGDLIVRGEKEKLVKIYLMFEIVFTQLVAIISATATIMILSFIKLYIGTGYQKEYYDLSIGILFSINALLNNGKAPNGMLVMAAGHYKETRLRSTIQAAILIIGGTIMSFKIGLAGLLMGVILSNLYRTIDLMHYVPTRILNISMKSSIKNTILMIATFLSFLPILKIVYMFDLSAKTWVQWGIQGLFIFITIAIISVLVVVVFNRGFAKEIYALFYNKIKINK